MRTIPGIEEATLANNLPVYSVSQQTFEIEGNPVAPDDREPIGFFAIGSNYFGVVSAAAISGREFNDGDRQGSLPVALVNQSFAARFLPGENPIGKRLRSTVRNRPNDWLTVVGVVPNIMQNDATRQQFKPLIYVPLRQRTPARAYFLVRTRMDPVALASTVRAEVQKIDSDVSLEEMMTLKAHMAFDRDYMDALHSELEKHATVAPIFAVIALVLAAIGIIRRDRAFGGPAYQGDRRADGDRRDGRRYPQNDLRRRDAAGGRGDDPGSCGIAGRKSRLAVAIGRRLALRSSDDRFGSGDSGCGGVARLRDSGAARDERRSGYRASPRLS